MPMRRVCLRGVSVAAGLLCLAATALIVLAPSAVGASTLVLRKVASGFTAPVYVGDAGDGSGRLFVVEQGGKIKIIRNGQVLSQPFLDISDRVGFSGEAGLLSVAFPPDFRTAGYFFVYYNANADLAAPEPSDAGNNSGYDTVVARFRLTSDPDRADPATEQRILVRNQPYPNHNGGLIAFGPDGYLYLGLGDGGNGGDPQNQAQNLDTLLGKMLRIQVGATGAYTIPASNPFAHTAGARGEIWAYGLRNPWRWSFDRATGDLYIGDVGQNLYEEVDFQAVGQGGLNYGWRCLEGLHVYNNTPPCPASLTAPIAEYDHSQGEAVVGGYVYRGAAYPALEGRYLYADYAAGKLWSLQKNGAGFTTPALEITTGFAISSFGEDSAGELYLADFSHGVIYQVTDSTPPATVPPINGPYKWYAPVAPKHVGA